MVLAAEMDHLIGTLKDAGLCKDVHYKELYIPQAELEGACAGYIDHVYRISTSCAGVYLANDAPIPAVWMQAAMPK